MDIESLKKLASLSRISFTDEELVSISKDFESILGFVDQIKEVDISDVKDTTLPVKNVFREDESSHESKIHTDFLINENSPNSENNYLKVKKIL